MSVDMWVHAKHAGESFTFLICDDDETPISASDYLHSLRLSLSEVTSTVHTPTHPPQHSIPSVTLVEKVYRHVLVYVSLLDDPNAVPTSLTDPDSALPDLWSPFYITTLMEDAATMSALLTFHQHHALPILEGLAREERTEEMTEESHGAPRSPPHAAASLPRGVEVRHELGGAVALLLDPSSETAGEETGRLLHAGCITHALRPFLMATARWGAADTEGFVPRVVRSLLDGVAEFTTRLPALLVGNEALYAVCRGDLATLEEVLRRLDGLLVPVLYGRWMRGVGFNSSQGSSVNTTPWDTPQTFSRSANNSQSHSHTPCNALHLHPQQPQPQLAPFLLASAPQEMQQLAFLACWINRREAAARERAPPGSARQNREAGNLRDFRVALWNLKKSCHAIPPRYVWSGQLFILTKLLSPDCALEAFVDILEEGDDVLYATGVPAIFITSAVAGTVVASIPHKWRQVQLLLKKVETLFVDVPGVISTLRQYVTTPPTNEAERFEELWCAKTPISPTTKFESRAEMFYFVMIELVLLGAEEKWELNTKDHSIFRDEADQLRAQHTLRDWVNVCRKFFISLRDRPIPSPNHRRSASRPQSDHTSEAPALHKNDATLHDEHDFDALRRVCAMLPMRLKEGKPPCPVIYSALYPVEETHPAEGHMGHGKPAQETLEEQFEAAQVAFGLRANNTSDQTKLKFYSLFKQATVGDVNIAKPWPLDPVGRAKWDAWNQHKGLSKTEAMKQYIEAYKILNQ